MSKCGAKTRSGGVCQRHAVKGGKRCKLHGGASTGAPGNTNASKHGFYSDALQVDERVLWERVEIGSVDDEIRLLRVKLHRLVQLSGSAEVADLVEAAIEVTRKQGEEYDREAESVVPYDKLEIKTKAARYGDLIIQAIGEIRKLELQRLQMKLLELRIEEGGDGGGDKKDISGFEAVPYDE